VTEEFTKDKILEIKKKYIDYADSMISEKDFKPNPTILCGWCDFLQDCKEGLNQTSKKQQINGEIDW
jgi:hypothetical protein